MTLTLSINKSPKNWVSKHLYETTSITGTLRANCAITDPVIEVEQTADVLKYNYAYIPEFHRYYYIMSVTSTNNGFWVLSMHVDVLMSFWDAGLKDCLCIVGRSATRSQLDLVDDEMYFTADTIYVNYNFPNKPFNTQIGGNNRNYTLVLAGSSDN